MASSTPAARTHAVSSQHSAFHVVHGVLHPVAAPEVPLTPTTVVQTTWPAAVSTPPKVIRQVPDINNQGRHHQRGGAITRALRPLFRGSTAAVPGTRLTTSASNKIPASQKGGDGAHARSSGAAASTAAGSTSLVELPEGPYMLAGVYLDAKSLCQVDVCCRVSRLLNQSNMGPWRALGCRECHGVELEGDGVFDDETCGRGDKGSACGPAILKDPTGQLVPMPPRFCKFSRVDWKGRYWRFKKELPTFRPPFVGTEISRVRNPDEVAYCRCMLRADVLSTTATTGVYIEIEVLSNPDNLSLAVVDFEAGGHSSVTFSPDTGAVIRERKVREVPRKVEGAYIQPLAATLPGRRFEGSVALYLFQGHLAFLRRCTSDAATHERSRWETTGFVTDLSWAEGRCLTPCLAFRDEGTYQVKIAYVGTDPPLPLDRAPTSYDEGRWAGLDWEAEAIAV